MAKPNQTLVKARKEFKDEFGYDAPIRLKSGVAVREYAEERRWERKRDKLFEKSGVFGRAH